MKYDNSLAAKEQLIFEHQGLVVSLAKSFNPPNITEFDEYVQVGNIGLWKATETYDDSRGTSFTTLAWYCIRNEIIRYIKKEQKNKVVAIDNEIINNNEYQICNNYCIEEILPSSLTEKEKNVLHLRLEGYTFGEIGEMLGGISKCGTSNIFQQAVKKIRISNV